MTSWIKILIFILILSNLTVYSYPAHAAVNISNIEVYDFHNGRARLHWDTYPEATRAFIYWGESPEDLYRSLGYGIYSNRHETVLTGLKKDTNYFVKIIAISHAGQQTESFLQTFNTRDMIDTILPTILDRDVLQVTRDAAIINWTTDEETRANIHYGTQSFNLKYTAGDGRLSRDHQIILYKLDTDQKYYIQIEAIDGAGNKKSRSFSFRTGKYLDRDTDLKIYNIQPLNFNPELISNTSATIKWRTNLAAKSRIHYGLESRRYNKQLDVSVDVRTLEHKIELKELLPDTTYYYEIEVFDSVYRKNKRYPELTFTTSKYSNAPQVKGASDVIRQPREYFDSDSDKLSDNFEMEIGTDPFKFDTDGDGYGDGNEMQHGYDPLIPGSTWDTKLKPERYFMPKLPDSVVLSRERELGVFIKSQLGSVRVSDSSWRVLVNAYVYGQYPAEAIVAAIRHGGKTVHPRINWTAWKNSDQYRTYIN